MTQMYGGRWTREYGEKPLELWAIKLAPYGAKQFRAVIQSCLKRQNPQQVPTLPEIVQYCEIATPRNYPRLPEKVIDEAQMQRNRQQIRSVLRMLGVNKV